MARWILGAPERTGTKISDGDEVEEKQSAGIIVIVSTKDYMRTYSFAKIKTRPFPTMADLNNKWIFGGVDSVINVSEKENGEIVSELKKRGVEYHHFPLKEEVPNIGWGNIQKAVAVILKNIDRDKSMVVHCIGGNHRSPLVVEAAYYSKFHKHIEDEYKGCRNHLIYNCENCFLPLTLREIETELELVGK